LLAYVYTFHRCVSARCIRAFGWVITRKSVKTSGGPRAGGRFLLFIIYLSFWLPYLLLCFINILFHLGKVSFEEGTLLNADTAAKSFRKYFCTFCIIYMLFTAIIQNLCLFEYRLRRACRDAVIVDFTEIWNPRVFLCIRIRDRKIFYVGIYRGNPLGWAISLGN